MDYIEDNEKIVNGVGRLNLQYAKEYYKEYKIALPKEHATVLADYLHWLEDKLDVKMNEHNTYEI